MPSKLHLATSTIPASEALSEMAKVAWRNHARCIGRLHWNRLETFDARHAGSPEEVYAACVEHLLHSTNGGRIRPTVTLFREADSQAGEIRIWNDQLIRYAGYRGRDGSILGDPAQADFTEKLISMGWRPPSSPGMFDLLPLVIAFPGSPPRLFELPREAVLEVEIRHPDLPWFRELGLRWHALPAVSNMALVQAGLRFTAAPFSGHYMATEIASRNLGDEQRYDLLPTVARRMGLDTRSSRSLWKDRALIELNAAVLHSFAEDGVLIVDHHTASRQFSQHLRLEEAAGRTVPGDWTWLVPPMSGSSCPVFHRYYSDERPEPSFVEQARPWHTRC